jgi:hypothetical protein
MKAVLVLALSATLQQQVQDTSIYARAESLLVAGELGDARRILERQVRRDRDDVRALTLLGRVHLAWPVIGRWKAWDYLESARKADPGNPEPPYWQIQVGLHLAMEDGQWMIKRGLFDVWRSDPHYRDTWDIADQVYWSNEDRREAAVILAAHGTDPFAALQGARLLADADECEPAAAVLDSLVAAGHENGTLWALRAQCALQGGDGAAGSAYYERALAQSESDSLGLLWRQVAGIAYPEEDSAYVATPPGERETFLRGFWSRREPDLTTASNERIAEHFERLAHARSYYPLVHPQALYHSSPLRRALFAGSGAQVLSVAQQFGLPTSPLPGNSRLEDAVTAAGLGLDLRDIPEPDSVTRYRRYGLDGRGLMYLRFGPPHDLFTTFGSDTPIDVERWIYDLPEGYIAVTFAWLEGAGDMLLHPISRTELHNTLLMLESDESSIAADLEVDAWVATFRGALSGYQLVYVGAAPDSGAAALWDAEWNELVRIGGVSPFVFHVEDRNYHLGVDVREGERLGRLRADVPVADLWRDYLMLSSILVAPLGDTAYSREDVARAMPGTRRLPVGSPLALYAEIYELAADPAGFLRYEVEYAFMRGGEPVLTVRFERQAQDAPMVPERVIFAPGRVPRGEYRIVMRVRDLVRGSEARTTLVDVELR